VAGRALCWLRSTTITRWAPVRRTLRITFVFDSPR
jgi:hypothetical protein